VSFLLISFHDVAKVGLSHVFKMLQDFPQRPSRRLRRWVRRRFRLGNGLKLQGTLNVEAHGNICFLNTSVPAIKRRAVEGIKPAYVVNPECQQGGKSLLIVFRGCLLREEC
jgi:hypothetical protein